MKRVMLLILFLCSTCSGQFFDLVPNQKPMLGQPICFENALSSSLVGCWLMNEGAGTRVGDLSGNARLGTVTGATWTASRLGAALAFDGDGSDYVLVNDDPALRFGTGDFTIVANFRNDTAVDDSGGNRNIVAKGRVTSGEWMLDLKPSTGAIRFYGDGMDLTTTDGWITVGVEYQVVVTRAGSLVTLYVNSLLAKTYATSSQDFNTTKHIYIGRNGDVATRNWLGLISGVCFYRRALSPSEIARLYREPYAMFRPSFNLVNYGAFLGGTTLPPLFHHYQLLNLN